MAKKLLKGNSPDIVDANVRMLKDGGLSHAHATHLALKHANKKHDTAAKKIAAKVAKSETMHVKIKGT